MITVYFQPISGSVSGSGVTTVYIDYATMLTEEDRQTINPQISPQSVVGSKVLTYSDSLVTITGSFGVISGSQDRVIVYSTSSTVLATFPTQTTTVVYLTESGSLDNPYPFDYTSSLVYENFSVTYNFSPSQTITSSLNRLAIYSASSDVTYSLDVSQSQASGYTTLNAFTTYSIELSGSGFYYTSSLKIEDAVYGNVLVHLSASNSTITTSFTSPQQAVESRYTLTAVTDRWPVILLEYNSAASIPVANSGSVSEWNSLLGIAASNVELSGGNVYLLGGTLTNTGSLSLYYPDSSSLLNGGLRKLTTSGLTDLQSIRIESGSATGSLREFPTVVASNLTSLVVTWQKITGSTPNILSYGFPTEVNCSLNQLNAGILPFDSQSAATLNSFDCSYNQLTGSIPPLSHLYSLTNFNCAFNNLSGSIPVLPPSIQYFKCLNGYSISGSIPDLASYADLTYFDCSQNKLSGSIPSLDNNPLLDTFNCGYNFLTGSIPSFVSNSLLRDFRCGINNLSGSIPVLPPSIQYFECQGNSLTGGIPDLSNNPSLLQFGCTNNTITGSIPNLSNNTLLTQFNCGTNLLTTYVSSSLPFSLVDFGASNNQLDVNSVDGILVDLDNAGNVSGSVTLNSGLNATPSAVGLAAASNLISKAWYVLTN